MDLKPLPISDTVPTMGLPVVALGFPLGMNSLKISSGVVAGNEEVEGLICIQSTAPISPGSSGGPLLLDDGSEVVGHPHGFFATLSFFRTQQRPRIKLSIEMIDLQRKTRQFFSQPRSPYTISVKTKWSLKQQPLQLFNMTKTDKIGARIFARRSSAY